MVGEVISDGLEDAGSLSGCVDLSFYRYNTKSKQGVYAELWWAREEHPKQDSEPLKKNQNFIGGNDFRKTPRIS